MGPAFALPRKGSEMKYEDAMAMHARLTTVHGEYEGWNTEWNNSETLALARDIVKAVRTFKREPQIALAVVGSSVAAHPETVAKVGATVLAFLLKTAEDTNKTKAQMDRIAKKLTEHLTALVEADEEQPEAKEQVEELSAKKPRTKVKLSPDLDKVAKAAKEAVDEGSILDRRWAPNDNDRAIMANAARTLEKTPMEAIDGSIGNPLRGYLLDIQGAYNDDDPITAHKIIKHMTESNYAPAGSWARYIVSEYDLS